MYAVRSSAILVRQTSSGDYEPAIEPIGGAIDAVADVVVEETVDVAGAMEEAKPDEEEPNVNLTNKDASEAEAGEAEDNEVKKEDRMELLDARLRRIEVAVRRRPSPLGKCSPLGA